MEMYVAGKVLVSVKDKWTLQVLRKTLREDE